MESEAWDRKCILFREMCCVDVYMKQEYTHLNNHNQSVQQYNYGTRSCNVRHANQNVHSKQKGHKPNKPPEKKSFKLHSHIQSSNSECNTGVRFDPGVAKEARPLIIVQRALMCHYSWQPTTFSPTAVYCSQTNETHILVLLYGMLFVCLKTKVFWAARNYSNARSFFSWANGK